MESKNKLLSSVELNTTSPYDYDDDYDSLDEKNDNSVKDLLNLSLYYKKLSKTYKRQLIEANRTIKELNETIRHMEISSWQNKKKTHENSSIESKKFIDKCSIYCEKINNINSSDFSSIGTKENIEIKQQLIQVTLKKTLKEKNQLQNIISSMVVLLKSINPDIEIDETKKNQMSYIQELINSSMKFKKEYKQAKLKCDCDDVHVNKINLNSEFYLNCTTMFQNLFDVKCYHHVPTKMNEIYYKFGQLINFKQSVINVMELSSDISIEKITAAIQKMYNEVNDTTGKSLRECLKSNNIQTIINKVQLHDEYLPLFHKLLEKIMSTLEISRLDQILPSIKALKILATPTKH